MISQVLITVLFMTGFGGIIFLSEYLNKHFDINPEYTRKMAHMLSCLSSLMLIFTITSHWYILFLGSIFFFTLFTGKCLGFFNSIDSVSRKSSGSYILPVAIYLVFYLSNSHHSILIFILPVLILGLSDPLAGLAGVYYKSRTRNITVLNYDFEKTVLGSFVFFITALLISSVTLYFFDFELQRIFFLSMVIAGTTTLVELVSPYGFDNLSVPVFTAVLLIWMG